MMKRFSTRANKWFYVFALISHIFNFFAKSQILFLYHIDDHQENYLFFCWFYFIQSLNHFFILFVHFHHIFFFSCSVFLFFFLSIFLFFFLLFSVFVDRLSLVFRRLFVISLIFEKSKSSFFLFFSFLVFFSFFFLFFFRCLEILNQSTTFTTCLRTQTFAIT